MSAFKKIAGIVAGASAVTFIGVAVAQSVPPNPFVSNHAQAAGQQSTHLTWMGETGTPWGVGREVTAQVITPVQEAAAPAPAPAPAPAQEVAQAAPAPAPAPVQETQSMGASPAPQPEVVAQAPARADRN